MVEWEEYYLHLVPLVVEHPKILLSECKNLTSSMSKLYRASNDCIGDCTRINGRMGRVLPSPRTTGSRTSKDSSFWKQEPNQLYVEALPSVERFHRGCLFDRWAKKHAQTQKSLPTHIGGRSLDTRTSRRRRSWKNRLGGSGPSYNSDGRRWKAQVR